jgi:hypothetical protein
MPNISSPRAAIKQRSNSAENTRLSRIKPVAIYPYIDRITVWVKQPLTNAQIVWLRQHCGKVHVRNRRADFDYLLKQRLQLCRPTDEVLRWLSRLPDVYLNYVEIALDWTFPNEFEREDAYEFVSRHFVKRYHGSQGIRFVRGVTRYTGGPSVPNLFLMYGDLPCRITGEIFCLHLEWRRRRRDNLQRAGIRSIADLLHLDHRAFWQKRLLLAEFNLHKLGGIVRRHFSPQTSKGPWISYLKSGVRWDHDRRSGHTLLVKFGSAQSIIDEFTGQCRVGRCIIPLGVGHLLPPPPVFSMIYTSILPALALNPYHVSK